MSDPASTNSLPPRPTSQINSQFAKSLAAYMAAASAAGLSILAVSQAAEAKIVYTPANTEISATSSDLNHDGIADFIITFHSLSHTTVLTNAPLAGGNSIRSGSHGEAAAGFFGVPVGPGEKFRSGSGGTYGWGVFMAAAFEYSVTSFGGPWANAVNRYLGLKFVIAGQTHYGWARLSVGDWLGGGKVVLTGYAYETTPNTNIIEGHTSVPAKASNSAPADLLAPASRPLNM